MSVDAVVVKMRDTGLQENDTLIGKVHLEPGRNYVIVVKGRVTGSLSRLGPCALQRATTPTRQSSSTLRATRSTPTSRTSP